MSKILTKTLCAPSEADSRRAFESAIAQIERLTIRPSSQTPIYARHISTTSVDPGAEKRALADAARALAQLWKISPARSR